MVRITAYDALIALATEHRSQPARAAPAVPAAADAGVGPCAHSAGLADAPAMTGDCTTAARLADDLLGLVRRRAVNAPQSGSPPASRPTTGRPGRLPICSGWLGSTRRCSPGRVAAMVAIGTGERGGGLRCAGRRGIPAR